jgi:hypothetical protein
MGLQYSMKQAKEQGGRLKEAAERIEREDASKTSLVPGCHRLYIRGWHPRKLNELIGRHPMAIHRLKQIDYAWIACQCDLQKIPRVPPGTKRRVHLVIHLAKGQRAGDPDAYFKVLGDALVKCGRLRDDNRQWVEWDPVEFARGGEKATTIELYDL